MRDESVSSVIYYSDFVMAPIASLLLMASIGFSSGNLILFGWGWLAWTLFEYWSHRALHTLPVIRIHHAFHHAKQNEFNGPSGLHSALIFAVFYFAMESAIGHSFADPLMSGLLAGYTAYLCIHDRIHRGEILPWDSLYKLKVHHGQHHLGSPNRFGVSTRLWDRVFGWGEG